MDDFNGSRRKARTTRNRYDYTRITIKGHIITNEKNNNNVNIDHKGINHIEKLLNFNRKLKQINEELYN